LRRSNVINQCINEYGDVELRDAGRIHWPFILSPILVFINIILLLLCMIVLLVISGDIVIVEKIMLLFEGNPIELFIWLNLLIIAIEFLIIYIITKDESNRASRKM
jgi:hypothetical protein